MNSLAGRIKHGGFGQTPSCASSVVVARFEDRAVHETVQVSGATATLKPGAILHHCYPTVSEAAATTTEEAQLGVGPEASVFYPPAKEFILAPDPKPCDCLLAFWVDAIC